MDSKGSENGAAPKVPVVMDNARTPFPWPWGLVAIGFLALSWVGLYLIWNGFLFLFGG